MAVRDPPPPADNGTPAQDDRLESWKAIAVYLRRDVTTVQRWERHEGLPVHRLQHQKLGSVYAFRRELDAWRKRTPSAAGRPTPRIRLGVLLSVAALVASSAVFMTRDSVHRWVSGLRGRGSTEPLAVQVRPLTADLGDEAEPALSPDGNDVAFVWGRLASSGRHDLYVKQVVGGEPFPIANCAPPEDCFGPAWSPDSQYVAFLRRAVDERSAGRAGVFLVPALGGTERRVGSVLVTGGGLSWFPDGRTLAVTSDDAGGGERIALLTLTEGSLQPFSEPPAGSFDTRPAVSPDGSGVAFLRRTFDSPSSVLVVQAKAGTRPRPLGFGDREITDIGWSSDSRAVFASSEGGLYRVPVDGGTVSRVPLAARIGRLSVGRARNRVVVVSGAVQSDIWRVSGPAAATRLPLARALLSSTADDTRPLYSPDGRHIAFVTKRTGAPEIWTCGAEGDRCGPLPVAMRFTGQDRPAWSPDGDQLLFEAVVPGEQVASFYVFDVATRRVRKLAGCPPNGRNAVWAANGAEIYFSPDPSLRSGLWKVPTDGSRPPRRVIEDGGIVPVAESGAYLYLARFDRPAGTGMTATIWRVSLNDGVKEQIPGKVWGRYAVWKGRIVAVQQHKNDEGSSLVLIDPVTNGSQVLADVDGVASQPTVSADGRWILFAATVPQRDLLLIDLTPRAGGRADEWRFPADLPPLQRRLATGAGLNPTELTARSLSLPPR